MSSLVLPSLDGQAFNCESDPMMAISTKKRKSEEMSSSIDENSDLSSEMSAIIRDISSPATISHGWKKLQRKVSLIFQGTKASENCATLRPAYWNEISPIGLGDLKIHLYPKSKWIKSWAKNYQDEFSYADYAQGRILKQGINLKNDNVIYFSQSELKAYSVKSNNGILFQRRKPLKFKNRIFILSANDKLYIGEKKKTLLGRIQHSSFSKGRPVKSAGWIKCSAEGKVTEIANFSGHYRPKKPQVYNIIKHLHHMNVDLKDVTLAYSPNGQPKDHTKYSVPDWLEQNKLQLL
ncbi:MAG: hypothetical protein ACI9S8_001992 [Chlamydiales bacterium]|jgi:hypothetical protein